jgi:hypothetical protein
MPGDWIDVKIRYIIAGIALLVAVIVQLLPPLIVVVIADEFYYRPSEQKREGVFVPNVGIRPNTLRLPFLFLRFDLDRPPHDIFLSQTLFPHNCRGHDEEIISFTVEGLQVEFSREVAADCLEGVQLTELRSLPVFLEPDLAPLKIFGGIVPGKEDLVIHVNGFAVDEKGNILPFKVSTAHEHKRHIGWHINRDAK